MHGASVAAIAHQARSLEDAQVLRHRRLRHARLLGERAYGLLSLAHQSLEDCPPRWIGQGLEQVVASGLHEQKHNRTVMNESSVLPLTCLLEQMTPNQAVGVVLLILMRTETTDMHANVDRRTVDLSAYPDMVVIYLGMRVNAIAGLKTLFGFGPRIADAVGRQPDGLLLHETMLFSLVPPHAGMRQYWRDFESLETWARSAPHREWWARYMRDTGGTGFWHEAYFMAGGMEAVYVHMLTDTGFLRFASQRPATGSVFSARGRARRAGAANIAAPVAEHEIYSRDETR